MALKDKLRARRATERKLRKHRDLLLQSVRTHILPVFIQQGFSAFQRQDVNPVDRKYLGAFPFEIFRRARPDGGVDLLEVQFMSYQRAAFRINACAVPQGGIMTLGGLRTVD